MVIGPDPLASPWQVPKTAKTDVERPTANEAKTTFWGLGDNYWMQMIDGKYHQLGPRIFDDGLHGKEAEPGFLASLEVGCRFACDAIGEPLTVDFYKNLHRTLCSHFKGSENNTEMSREKTGVFRTKGCDFIKDASFPDEFYEHLKKIREFIRYYEDDGSITFKDKPIPQELNESKLWIENFSHQIHNQSKGLNLYIEKFLNNNGFPCFIRVGSPKLDNMQPVFKFTYQIENEKDLDRLTHKIFHNYNTKMSSLNQRLAKAVTKNEVTKIKDEKLILIAETFQFLEWLHPFQDGQGRTDLVLLARLLSEEGFNPAILKEPYVSSWSTLEEWKQALIAGMDRWKQVQQQG